MKGLQALASGWGLYNLLEKLGMPTADRACAFPRRGAPRLVRPNPPPPIDAMNALFISWGCVKSLVGAGRAGVAFEEVTSVNRVGTENSYDASFPGLVGAEASEWRTHTLTDFNTLGPDATISLFITDVGSTVRTSAVSIDHLRVE